MKVATGVGNIELCDIPEPSPQAGQVLIKVHTAGLCGTDLHILKDEFRSWPPVVLGHEIAGEIEALGEGVTGLTPGDKVTTETYFSYCGVCRYCRAGQMNLCLDRRSIGSGVNGGFTQYVVVPQRNIHRLPDNVNFRAGALTEPLACVVHSTMTTLTVAPGDLAVIAGPGAIGLLTAQVAKTAGATVVMLGTDTDEHRLALARTLGADYTVNVHKEDAGKLIRELSVGGFGADVVYECSGAGMAAASLLDLVRRRGRYVQIGLFGKPIGWDMDQICFKEVTVTGSNASVPWAWDRAIQLIASGAVKTETLISNTFDITDWEKAFATFEDRTGIKTVLRPVG